MSENKNNIRQLVIIGAGPGGYAAAFHAADLGLKVTLVDKEQYPGGVCLYRGCIPSKALLHAAKIIYETKKAKDWGIDFAQPDIDLDKLREWKNSVVAKLVKGLGALSKKRKIEYMQGTAQFISGNGLKIQKNDGESEEIEFEKAIIATGSSNVELPNIPMDSENVIDSTGSLEIKDIPERMLVIGGGYIGLEQANIYARLGSQVSVVEMAPQLLPGTDRDIVSVLTKHFRNLFDETMLNSKVSRIEDTKEGIKVWFEGDAEKKSGQTYNKILVSVGRKPNISDIGLEHTHVKLDENNYILVDNQRKTKDKNIFAIGDVTGDPMFAHKATHEGLVASEVIAGKQASFDPMAIPFVEYTELEVAGCGLNENQAREKGYQVKPVKFPWSASGRALTMGEKNGFTKLIFEQSSGRVLGVNIIGSDAGKLISQCALAVEMGAVAEDLARTIHPHPTLSETIMEAAEGFFGKSIHL